MASKQYLISDLEKLLINKRLIPNAYYVTDSSLLAYIQVYTTFGDVVVIYINSDYDFVVSPTNVHVPNSILSLTKLSVNEIGMVENYVATSSTSSETEIKYTQPLPTEIVNIPHEHADLLSALESKYTGHPKSDKGTAEKFLSENIRLLQRLRFSVANAKYKVGILQNNTLSLLRKDNTIYAYTFENTVSSQLYSNTQRLFITTDIRTLYQNLVSFNDDVQLVKNTVRAVLLRNINDNTNIFNTMMTMNIQLPTKSKQLKDQLEKIETYIVKLENMALLLTTQENNISQKLVNLKKETSLTHEAQRLQKITNFTSQLHDVYNLKETIISDLVALKSKQEKIMMDMDNVYFGNTVLFHTIIQNLKLLYENTTS